MTDRYRQIWGRSAVTRKDSLAGDIVTGGWESGDPINSITLFTEGTFPAGSSFAIFGVIR
jgi:hypothetical protein